MTFSNDNDASRSIHIGNKVSLTFMDPPSSNKRKELIGMLDILKDKKVDLNHKHLEIKDLLDRVWIQIGENPSVFWFFS